MSIEVRALLPIMAASLEHDPLPESVDHLESLCELVQEGLPVYLAFEDEDPIDDHQIARLVHAQPGPVDAGDGGSGGFWGRAHESIVYTLW